MAETKTTDDPGADLAKDDEAPLAKADAPAPSYAFTGGPPLGLRALVGFSGIALLVGFFIPWFHVAADETNPARDLSGFTMMLGAPVAGTPAILLIGVPILGGLLSAAAFMGFRWTAHAAIGVASALLGFGLWILLWLFVEHTALGLWITVGSAFITLLLGVLTLMYTRDKDKKQGKQEKAKGEPKKAEAKKAEPAKKA
jgi:hypothetical protein